MTNIDMLQLFTSRLIYVMAYFIMVPLTGYGQAWLAKKMGDDTADYYGLLTFNPMVHFDLFGFVFLLLSGWGFGRSIPVQSDNLRFKSPILRKLFAAFLPVIVYFLFAVAMIFIAVMFGGYTTTSVIAPFLPMMNPTLISLRSIVQATIVLNITLITIHTIWGFIKLFMDIFSIRLDSGRSFAMMMLILIGLALIGVFAVAEVGVYWVVIVIERLFNSGLSFFV